MAKLNLLIQIHELDDTFYSFDYDKQYDRITVELEEGIDSEISLDEEEDRMDELITAHAIAIEMAVSKYADDDSEIVDGDCFVSDYLLRGQKKMYLVEKDED